MPDEAVAKAQYTGLPVYRPTNFERLYKQAADVLNTMGIRDFTYSADTVLLGYNDDTTWHLKWNVDSEKWEANKA